MQKLTQRQKMVLEFIQTTIDTDGYPPTLREIGNFMGIRSTNGVNDHLRALERKGYLTRKDMKSRTLRPTRAVERMLKVPGLASVTSLPTLPEPAFDDLLSIPILGHVAAGSLQEAIEQPSDHVRIDKMLVGPKHEVFGLRIRGESMIEAGIHDGDYVFVRKQLEATRGQIVIALVGDEATCKYFFPERDHIRLEPANSKMAPILIPKTDWRDTQLLGVVAGIYRKLLS
ncbi:MAG TPA: transcriptional repressor LexA [Polyangiales bacterium]|nr:transcriptional repressor LexA [Polyangiales bacterium]